MVKAFKLEGVFIGAKTVDTQVVQQNSYDQLSCPKMGKVEIVFFQGNILSGTCSAWSGYVYSFSRAM